MTEIILRPNPLLCLVILTGINGITLFSHVYSDIYKWIKKLHNEFMAPLLALNGYSGRNTIHSGGFRGGAGGAGGAPPTARTFLNFMQFFGKFGNFVCWRPPPPPPGWLAPPPTGNPGSAPDTCITLSLDMKNE